MQKAVDDAKASVEQLHSLAELFAQVSIQQIAFGERWGGTSRKVQSDMINGIADGLADIGMPAPKMKAILDAQKPAYAFDYFHIVMRAAKKVMNGEQRAAYEIWSESFHNKGIGFEPNPATTETFLAETGIAAEEVTGRLLDFKHFQATGTHRRTELWFANYNDSR